MSGVIDQVLDQLRQGEKVKGSIELPDSLILWELDFKGNYLRFRARASLGLDEPIPFALPATDPDPRG